MQLNKAIWRRGYPKRILFRLAHDKGAGRAASCPNNAIENENRYSVLLSLDYIPDLSNLWDRRYRGQPAWKWGTELCVRRVPPPSRGRRTYVLEAPSSS